MPWSCGVVGVPWVSSLSPITGLGPTSLSVRGSLTPSILLAESGWNHQVGIDTAKVPILKLGKGQDRGLDSTPGPPRMAGREKRSQANQA